VADKTDTDEDAISFARVAFGSVSALELLILLRRGRQRSYRIDELVRELRSSELAVTRALDHLMKFDLVEERPGSSYLYQQGSARLDSICERVESVYVRKPVALVRAMLEAPDEKLRVFADAFRISGRNK